MTAEPDPLERLLHRARREELLPLATMLRVNAGPLGLGDLARIVAQQARRVASHGLGNIFLRKGEGLPYAEILADASKRLGLPADEPEAMETALCRAWFVKRWDTATPDERARYWAQLGVDGDVPAKADEAVKIARTRLGRSFAYALSGLSTALVHPGGAIAFSLLLMHPAGCLVRPFLPILMPYLVWKNLQPSEDQVSAIVMEVARIRQIVLHRVTIGVVGSPSTGKDAGIKALFGIDTGNISPIAGSTKEVAIQRLPGSTALYIVNTPGMGDVVESVTEEARQVIDHIDLYLYLVNAEGGVQARELSDYKRCVATGKPVLAVVNKVDVLRPRDKEKYLADARDKLGAAEEDFLPVAFDPLPQLAPGPIGLAAVHAWLSGKLEALGKDPTELPPLPPPGGEPPPPSTVSA